MNDTSDFEPTGKQLRELIDDQRRELEKLRAEVDTLRSRHVQSQALGVTRPSPPSTDRRQMLRRVGTVAAGTAIAASFVPRPVAAADGDSLIVGAENQGDTTTELFAGVNAANKSVLGVADARREIDIEGAVSGMATGESVGNGVVGYTSASLDTVETGHAIVSYPHDIEGKPSPRSNLWLRPQLEDPRFGSLEHTPGEIVSDTDGNLWHCVVRGTPGTWRRFSGAETAGAFVPITPARVYDSRLVDGKLAADTSRLVSVADFVDLSGNVIDTDGVPFGATAVAYNLAVVNTEGRGFLFVAPGDAATISAASINWDVVTTGAVNSGSVVAVDANRIVRVFCDGAETAATDFILDIVGYYL